MQTAESDFMRLQSEVKQWNYWKSSGICLSATQPV